MNRREVGEAFVGIAAGAALLEPLEFWLSDGRSGGKGGQRDESGIGSAEIEQIENSAAIFRNWDDRFGGGLRRKAVVGQLSEVSDLLSEPHSSGIRRRLFLVMADLAETAAMMSWDSGSNTLAQRYYFLALRASTEAGDRTFGANVLAGMARQLLCMDRAGEELEITRLALDGVPKDASPHVRAMLHTREAWSYARMGRVAAFRRATDRAEDVFTGAESAQLDEVPQWIRYFDQAELAGVTGGRLLELAHVDSRFAGEAAEYIERAVQTRPGQHLRSKALDEVGLAEALLLRGEVEEGVRLGHAAIETVEQTPSDRVQVKLVELYRYSGKREVRTRAVTEFRDRIRSTLRSGAEANSA